MKNKLIGSLLLLSFVAQFCAFLVVTDEVQAQVNQEILTNATVLELTKSGIPAEVIVEKIKSSLTRFDLTSNELQKLKGEGVADSVLVAMLQAGKTTAASRVAVEQEVLIPDGTEIEVQLKNNLSGQTAKEGDIVDLVVVRNVVVGETVVISEGATALARISLSKKSGYWGKTGKLEWTMQDVQTVGGKKIPCRFSKTVAGGSSAGAVAVGAVVTTVLLGPLGLLWGLKKGKEATIPAGTRFSVFTDKESVIKIKSSASKSQ